MSAPITNLDEAWLWLLGKSGETWRFSAARGNPESDPKLLIFRRTARFPMPLFGDFVSRLRDLEPQASVKWKTQRDRKKKRDFIEFTVDHTNGPTIRLAIQVVDADRLCVWFLSGYENADSLPAERLGVYRDKKQYPQFDYSEWTDSLAAMLEAAFVNGLDFAAPAKPTTPDSATVIAKLPESENSEPEVKTAAVSHSDATAQWSHDTISHEDSEVAPSEFQLLVFAADTTEVHEYPAQTLTIGRSRKNTLRLSDPTVSTEHLSLVLHSEFVTVRDLNTVNGIHVNGRKIEPETTAPIELPALLELGSVQILALRLSESRTLSDQDRQQLESGDLSMDELAERHGVKFEFQASRQPLVILGLACVCALALTWLLWIEPLRTL